MTEISVILPTIAVDAWFLETVDSVLQQEGANFELIVVLDGAQSDPSEAWRCDPRVRVVQIPVRSGLANALIAGIEQTDTPYIARIDADDVCLPGRLEKQISYLKEWPESVLVGAHAIRIDELGNDFGSLGHVQGADLRNYLCRRNILIHSSVMFRRAPYIASGGYDSTLGQMEDYDLWLRMASLGPVAVIDERLIQYRVHNRQMSRGAKPFGPHIKAVLKGQRSLGKHLGHSWSKTEASVLAWRTAQYLRYYGLRRPGYDRSTASRTKV